MLLKNFIDSTAIIIYSLLLYFDAENREIKFAAIDTDKATAHKFHWDQEFFEYYSENKKGELISQDVHQWLILKAINQTPMTAENLVHQL